MQRLATLTVLAVGVFGGAIASAALAETEPDLQVAATRSETPTHQTYLYGQTSEPEQLGQTYIVMERTGNQVVGAFYQPLSSFDCFSGTVQSNHLDLKIAATYTGETFAYQVALADSVPIASTGPVSLPETQLEGFRVIPELSANDRRILSTCKAANLSP